MVLGMVPTTSNLTPLNFFLVFSFFLLERGMITGFGGCGMCVTCNSLQMRTRLNNVY